MKRNLAFLRAVERGEVRIRFTLVVSTLSLASCQGQGEITKPDPVLSPPPPYTSACVSEGRNMFTPTTSPGPDPASGTPPKEWVLRSRFVTINFDILTAASTPGDAVRLNLFGDICFDAVLKRTDTSGPSPDLRSWVGSIPGDEFSTVALSFFPQGPLSGTISAPIASPRWYLVHVADAPAHTIHAIYEIDQRKVPP